MAALVMEILSSAAWSRSQPGLSDGTEQHSRPARVVRGENRDDNKAWRRFRRCSFVQNSGWAAEGHSIEANGS